MSRVTLTDLAKREADVLRKHCTERSHPREWHDKAVSLLFATQKVCDAARRYFRATHEQRCQCDPCTFLAELDKVEKGT